MLGMWDKWLQILMWRKVISLHNSPYSTVFSGRRNPWQQWSVEQQSYGTGFPYVCPPYYGPSCEYQQMSTTYPYTLQFITGNISSCFGCKNKYKKPPNDLCIQHQDWRVVYSSSMKYTKDTYRNNLDWILNKNTHFFVA